MEVGKAVVQDLAAPKGEAETVENERKTVRYVCVNGWVR